MDKEGAAWATSGFPLIAARLPVFVTAPEHAALWPGVVGLHDVACPHSGARLLRTYEGALCGGGLCVRKQTIRQKIENLAMTDS
jgi:hypothetical protein